MARLKADVWKDSGIRIVLHDPFAPCESSRRLIKPFELHLFRIYRAIREQARVEADEQRLRRLNAVAVRIRNRIVMAHLRLAAHLIRRCCPNEPSRWEELFSDLMLRLINCVECFNPDLGFQFSSYFSAAARNLFGNLADKRRRRVRTTGRIPVEAVAGGAEPKRSAVLRLLAARQLLRQLKPKARRRVRANLGIGTDRQEFQQIARKEGVSYQAVCQTVHRDVAKLHPCPVADDLYELSVA